MPARKAFAKASNQQFSSNFAVTGKVGRWYLTFLTYCRIGQSTPWRAPLGPGVGLDCQMKSFHSVNPHTVVILTSWPGLILPVRPPAPAPIPDSNILSPDHSPGPIVITPTPIRVPILWLPSQKSPNPWPRGPARPPTLTFSPAPTRHLARALTPDGAGLDQERPGWVKMGECSRNSVKYPVSGHQMSTLCAHHLISLPETSHLV